jgi:Activator of mitotic machinery Cdc14 phosphatase activation C-term
MPDSGDDVDAPIIVPRPGQVLRRSARTKIRKAGQTVQGAHRFNATRRGAGSKRDTPPPVPDPRSSSDFSAGENSDPEPPRRSRLLSNESLDEALRLRPESYSAEAFIFDAYARDEVNEDAIRVSSPPLPQSLPRRSLSPPLPLASKEGPELTLPIQVLPPAEPTSALPPLQHPLPQRAASLVTQAPAPVESPSRSPSPVTSIHSEFLSSTRPELRPAQMQSMSLSSMHPGPQGFDARREKEKEKDKKGLFKWGGGEKKGKKDQREKDKDAGFFGSFFSSKRKPEESPPMGLVHGQSARDAAVALLGAPKSSRGYVPSPSPQPPVNNFSRYPIHVERAIYRLSHIKLANPRRALYEQVLISNLMFWYLGVINKTQQPQQAQPQASTEKGPEVTDDLGPALQNEHEEQERAEVEQAEIERGEARLTMQGQGQGQGQQPASVQQSPPQGRRGSLTKVASSNTSPRRAEQPVRGPQYDMQHRVMEQEYGVAFAGARSTNTPASSGTELGYAAVTAGTAPSGPIQMSNSMLMSMSGPGHPPPPSSSSPHNATHLHAASSAIVGGTSPARSGASPRRSRSPPPPSGSSVRYVPPPPPPPVPITATASSRPSPIPSTSAPPAPASGPNSPAVPGLPQVLVSADARLPTRSLSANVTPPVGPRNPGRKAQSAHAILPLGARRPRTAESAVGVGREEEDVPLALWQQQQQQQQQQQYQQSLVNQQVRRR